MVIPTMEKKSPVPVVHFLNLDGNVRYRIGRGPAGKNGNRPVLVVRCDKDGNAVSRDCGADVLLAYAERDVKSSDRAILRMCAALPETGKDAKDTAKSAKNK